MNLYPLFKKLLITLSLIPLFSLATLYADPAIKPSAYPNPNASPTRVNQPTRIYQPVTQPRVYINQGLYQDYDQVYYNNSTVRGNTILSPAYNIPPAREPLRSPGSMKGPLKIEHMPARK